MEEEVKSLSKEITLVIRGNAYKITFPTNGQYKDIQSLKSALSRGRYNDLSLSPDVDEYIAKIYIDVIANFTVLIPELKNDMNIKSLEDLDMYEMQYLWTEVYDAQFLPWYNDHMAAISKISQEYFERKAKLDKK